MIPILYEHNALTFNSYGIGALTDTTLCEVTEERNGIYELVMKYPISGQHYNEIQKERLIKVRVNDKNSLQVFRIYRISAPISGIVTIYAQHISYDLSSIVVLPFAKLNSTPSQLMIYALARTLTQHHFSFNSEIANTADYIYETPKSIRAIVGGNEMSLISNVGGEIEWDNYVIKLHANRGNDNGVTLLYGKNLTKLEHNSDLTNIYTHLCPYAIIHGDEEDTTLTLTEGVLPIITTLNESKTLIYDFSSYFGSGDDKLEPTEANLRQVAHDFLLNNIIGIEEPNITLSFEELREQLGYSNLHETISLCDTVTVKYPGLGVNAKTKVVKTVYDVLKEKYKSLTLGAIKTNLADHILSIEKDIDDTFKQTLEIVPDVVKKAVDNATELITGGKGGCVVIEQETDTGYPTEFLIMNTPDKETATYVWRWNMGGLGFSSNGYNGPYTTAITADGSIVADFITTGSLTANLIQAGRIESLNGESYWDIETGDINITGSITATSGTFDNCTINDTCTFYGVLEMSGEEDVPIYGKNSKVTYETWVGGTGIDSYVHVQPKNDPNIHTSYSVIRPYGIVTVPDNYVNYANDHMMFGITERFSYKEQNLLAGMYFAYTHLTENEYNSFMQLKCGDKNCFFAEVTTDGNGWTQRTSVGIGAGTTDINGQYVTFMGSDGGWMETYYHEVDGDYYLDPLLKGRWWSDGQLKFGIETTSYQLRIDKDQITFYYNGNEIGDIECYISYVDIQGTWKTNGNNWISTSDIKTKNTIKELDDRYSVLFSNLQPRSFKFNEGKSGRVHSGFIVQEVLEAMEKAGISRDEYGLCCAFGDKDNPETIWGLRYEEIIALCVKEIQRLNKRVEELEDKK